MLAQSLIDFGQIAAALAAIERAVFRVADRVATGGPWVWLSVGLVTILLLRYLFRRRGL